MCIHSRTHACMHMHAHTHTYTHTHAYTHTHTHTHRVSQVLTNKSHTHTHILFLFPLSVSVTLSDTHILSSHTISVCLCLCSSLSLILFHMYTHTRHTLIHFITSLCWWEMYIKRNMSVYFSWFYEIKGWAVASAHTDLKYIQRVYILCMWSTLFSASLGHVYDPVSKCEWKIVGVEMEHFWVVLDGTYM